MICLTHVSQTINKKRLRGVTGEENEGTLALVIKGKEILLKKKNSTRKCLQKGQVDVHGRSDANAVTLIDYDN